MTTSYPTQAKEELEWGTRRTLKKQVPPLHFHPMREKESALGPRLRFDRDDNFMQESLGTSQRIVILEESDVESAEIGVQTGVLDWR
jgi:hypothetical protein